METEKRIERLCNAMGVFHDCNLEMKEAFGKDEHFFVFDKIGGVLEHEDTVRNVNDEIFVFILNELDFMKDLDNNFDFVFDNSADILGMTNCIFEGNYEGAVEYWNKLIEIPVMIDE